MLAAKDLCKVQVLGKSKESVFGNLNVLDVQQPN